MTTIGQKILNESFRELCAKHGEVSFKIKLLLEDLEDLEEKMRRVNEQVPTTLSLEQQIRDALSQAASEAAGFALTPEGER